MAAPNANARVLSVRSAQSAHLSFPVDGILEELIYPVGALVGTFDLRTQQALYGTLGNTSPDGSLLTYNSQAIYTAMAPYCIATLRAESTKAALDSAILSRQNAFYKKYADTAGIISQMDPWYRNNPAFSGSPIKARSLSSLASLAQTQQGMLGSQYISQGRTSVVMNTTNVVSNTSTTTASSSIGPGGTIVSTTSVLDNPNSYDGKADTFSINAEGDWTFTYPAPTSTTVVNTQVTANTGTVQQNGTTINTDYAYRVPAIENESQGTRSQISLTDETYSQYLFGVQVPYLAEIFKNELQILDLGVRRLQFSYLNTILTSPVPAGLVTGVFRNVGEYVKAGEPVVRIENPKGPAWLVGTLIYDGPIPIAVPGTPVNVSVTTSLNGAQATISGLVIAVRGNSTGANEYNVVIGCSGLGAFPLNYHFDCGDTTVTIS